MHQNGTELFFRGQLIWDTLMNELLSIGMSKAREVDNLIFYTCLFHLVANQLCSWSCVLLFLVVRLDMFCNYANKCSVYLFERSRFLLSQIFPFYYVQLIYHQLSNELYSLRPWMISFKMLCWLIYWWINCILFPASIFFEVDSYNCLFQLHRPFLQAALLVVWPLSYTVMIFGIFFPNMQMWSVLQMQVFSLMSMCLTFCFCRSQ